MFDFHTTNSRSATTISAHKSSRQKTSTRQAKSSLVTHAVPMLPFEVFDGVNQRVVESINAAMVHQKFGGKDYVYLPYDNNDNIYFIKSGNIELGYLDESGRELGVDILGPGELFGSVMGRNFEGGYARSIDGVMLGVMAKQQFKLILEKHPHFAVKILEAMSEKIQFLEKKLQNLVFNDVRTRICRLLESLYQKVGDKSNGQIRIPLTHQDVANLVASSRETASLHLSELRRIGAISYERKRIRILSLANLRDCIS